MTVWDRISLRMDEIGVLQKDLAKFLNTRPQTITDWKNGKTKSYQKFLPQIATFLDVPLDYLVSGQLPALPNAEIKTEYTYYRPIYESGFAGYGMPGNVRAAYGYGLSCISRSMSSVIYLVKLFAPAFFACSFQRSLVPSGKSSVSLSRFSRLYFITLSLYCGLYPVYFDISFTTFLTLFVRIRSPHWESVQELPTLGDHRPARSPQEIPHRRFVRLSAYTLL